MSKQEFLDWKSDLAAIAKDLAVTMRTDTDKQYSFFVRSYAEILQRMIADCEARMERDSTDEVVLTRRQSAVISIALFSGRDAVDKKALPETHQCLQEAATLISEIRGEWKKLP